MAKQDWQQEQFTQTRDFLKRALVKVEEVASKQVNVMQAFRIFANAISRNPALLQCTPVSLLNCLISSSELGLIIGPTLGHCYAVPFRNTENNTMEATFILGYMGMVELAYRSGRVDDISAVAVYANDEFDYELGTVRKIHHIPWDMLLRSGKTKSKDRGDLFATYCVANIRDGGQTMVVCHKEELAKAEMASKAKQSGPWKTHREQMCVKTAVRRSYKLWPKTTDMMLAGTYDQDDVDAPGRLIDHEELEGLVIPEVIMPATSQSDALTERLKQSTGAQPAVQPEPVAAEEQEPEPKKEEKPKSKGKGKTKPKDKEAPPQDASMPDNPNGTPKQEPPAEPPSEVDLGSCIETCKKAFGDLDVAYATLMQRNFAERHGLENWEDCKDANAFADLFDQIESMKGMINKQKTG